MIGKVRRLQRILNASGRSIIVPMDHGFTLGRIAGIKQIGSSIDKLTQSSVDALVMHKGTIIKHYETLQKSNVGLLLHISGSTNLCNLSNRKVLVSSVEEAIRLGCDGVSMHVNLGGEYESEMIHDFGIVSDECNKKGMPLLAMIYAKSEGKSNVGHAIQVAYEMGADMVKVGFDGDYESFAEEVEGAGLPVFVAGGERCAEEDLFKMLCTIFSTTTVSGISMGRNVFQSNHIDETLQVIKGIVYEQATLEESIELYHKLVTLNRDKE